MLSFVLFPGRHHLLTRFQARYLHELLAGGVVDTTGQPVRFAGRASVVWAVTSANHQNTRRNPVPYSRREAAIERFGLVEGVRCLVVPVVDTRPTDRFAAVTVTAVEVATAGQVRLTPQNTVVACSTPAVAAMYAELGFRIVTVEADPQVFPDTPRRPWDVLEALVAGDAGWQTDAHAASLDVFDRYALAEHVRMVCSDPIVGDEGSLTTTRAYASYQRSFEVDSDRKWEQVGPFVRPGRIVDIGCASGGLLERAGKDPRLHESDLIGVEVARHLYAEALHRQSQGVFENPNTFIYQRNILATGAPLFPDRSIDTTLTVALTHEISSYGRGLTDLEVLTGRIFAHTAPGGVWINSDVTGPADPDRVVVLDLDDSDGANPGQVRTDLADLDAAACAAYVAKLSTRARLAQFRHDFPALSGARFAFTARPDGSVQIPLAMAMEFLTRKDYVDNWISEAHERFTDMSFPAWSAMLTTAGFELDPVSRGWTNPWLVEHRFDPCARLLDLDGATLPWPDTHVLVVARRPDGL